MTKIDKNGLIRNIERKQKEVKHKNQRDPYLIIRILMKLRMNLNVKNVGV